MGLIVKSLAGDEGSVKVSLVGDLDAEGGAIVRRAIAGMIEAGSIDVMVNLDGVGFLDSSGLAGLISSLRFARERGGDVRIETSNARIRRVMEVTALSRVFKLQPAAAAA